MLAIIPDDLRGIDNDTPVSMRMRAGVPSCEIMKHGLDCCLALVMLILTAPLVLLCMLLVRLTSTGPALYTQQRLGRYGRPFQVYKLRTMYQDSERESGAVWSLPGDRRVTPIGRFLRASHIDELPQLVNVLIGDMSLIGPRPERPEIAAELQRVLPDYRLRLSVRPGLTGLAQVLQAPDTHLGSVRRKLDYDLYYLERCSFWFDLRILLATVLHLARVAPSRIARLVFFSRNAMPSTSRRSMKLESDIALPALQSLRPSNPLPHDCMMREIWWKAATRAVRNNDSSLEQARGHRDAAIPFAAPEPVAAGHGRDTSLATSYPRRASPGMPSLTTGEASRGSVSVNTIRRLLILTRPSNSTPSSPMRITDGPMFGTRRETTTRPSLITTKRFASTRSVP